MPIMQRDKRGQARSAYSERDLYDVVAAITRYVSPHGPEQVSQRAFDRSRSGAGHPDAPSARAICTRLGSSWGGLLERCLDPDLDLDRSHARRRGSRVRHDYLDARHLHFALNLVARQLDKTTLTPGEYASKRTQLIRSESRRRGERVDEALLPMLMPTVGQIEGFIRRAEGRGQAQNGVDGGDGDRGDRGRDQRDQAQELADLIVDDQLLTSPDHDQRVRDEDEEGRGAGSSSAEQASDSDRSLWDQALLLAGLAARPAVRDCGENQRKHRGMLLAVAIHHFYEVNGCLPSREALREFARRLGIALEQHGKKPWAEVLEDARVYRSSLGLETPAADEPRPRLKRSDVKVPKGGIPGATPASPIKRGQHRYTREDCLEALRCFDAELPASEPRTQKRYLAFSTEQGRVPPSRFQRFGGFTQMMREARNRAA
jgi:hypothetical protein